MSRAFLAVGALLASIVLAQAGDQASFSPDLMDAPVTSPVTAPQTVVAEPAPSPRGRSSKRRTRLARAKARRMVATASLKPTIDAAAKTLTIGAVPAPLPPSRDDGKVAEAVATMEMPPTEAAQPGGNTEAAAPTPASRGPSSGGQREAPSQTLAEMLARHALANGVPLKLAQAVVRIESRGNAHASNHGALGLMQIKYGTARAVGFAGPAIGLFVADTNLRYGMKVLAQAWREAGGDLCGALMRYQSGHLARHANAANRAYCSRARALMAGT